MCVGCVLCEYLCVSLCLSVRCVCVCGMPGEVRYTLPGEASQDGGHQAKSKGCERGLWPLWMSGLPHADRGGYFIHEARRTISAASLQSESE